MSLNASYIRIELALNINAKKHGLAKKIRNMFTDVYYGLCFGMTMEGVDLYMPNPRDIDGHFRALAKKTKAWSGIVSLCNDHIHLDFDIHSQIAIIQTFDDDSLKCMEAYQDHFQLEVKADSNEDAVYPFNTPAPEGVDPERWSRLHKHIRYWATRFRHIDDEGSLLDNPVEAVDYTLSTEALKVRAVSDAQCAFK